MAEFLWPAVADEGIALQLVDLVHHGVVGLDVPLEHRDGFLSAILAHSEVIAPFGLRDASRPDPPTDIDVAGWPGFWIASLLQRHPATKLGDLTAEPGPIRRQQVR